MIGVEQQLFDALYANDLERARLVLGSEPDVHARDDHGLTPLMVAAGLGLVELVQALIERGADVDALDTHAGASALHKACQRGAVDVVRALLDAGASVDLRADSTGHSPIVEAIWYKWPEVVALLLDRDADLGGTTRYGFTIQQHIDYALRVNQNNASLRQIADLVAARQRRDAERIEAHPLLTAALEGSAEQVRALLAQGVEVDVRWPIQGTFQDGHTPLLLAARGGHLEVVRLLLDHGADVNAIDPQFGAVPLHKATYHGYEAVTARLAAHAGVNLNYQGPSNGYTPLLDSLWHGYGGCAAILLDAGADASIRGFAGEDAVTIATRELGPDHEVTQRLRSPHSNR